MSEAEKQVLKTFKSGLGITSAEQEILVNYIDKLQKELKESINAMLEFHRKARELEDLINEVIKRIPLEDDEGNPTTTKENLLENLDFFFSEWERLEDKEDEEIQLASLNYVHKREIRKKIDELDKLFEDNKADREMANRIEYGIETLTDLLEENE